MRWTFLLLFTLFGCRPLPALTETSAESAEDKSVALVHYVDADGEDVPHLLATEMKPYCTGVWVGQNQILTAAHCVAGLAKPEGTDPTGRPLKYSRKDEVVLRLSHDAFVEKFDDKHDLALVRTGLSGLHEIAHLELGEIHDGDEVHIVGQTLGLWFSYCHGFIASTREAEDDSPKVFQISAPVWFGNSGGGAFDADGRLVGIASYIRRNGPELAFFVHRDVIKEFLK